MIQLAARRTIGVPARAPVDVLHVIPYMHPSAGGPPVVVDRFCRAIASRGWTNRVVTTDALADDDTSAWLQRYGSEYPIDLFRTSKLGSYGYSRELVAQIDELVVQSRLVHLHTLWTHPTRIAMQACRRQSIPYVVMPHGMLDPASLRRKWLKKQLYGRLLEWPSLRRARAMIYTHEAERRLAESSVAGLPEGYVVSLGADDPPSLDRKKLAADFYAHYPDFRCQRLITFLGRVHPKKGLDLLIPAMARLADLSDVHLVIAGPGSPAYISELRNRIARVDLSLRVTFTGSLDGRLKWAALAASSVFVLPSYQENFALTVVEAQKVGVPVVISRYINIWKEIVAGGGGVACDLNEVAIADAIRDILNDSAKAMTMGVRGQQYVRERFTWAAAADALDRLYSEILDH